MLLQAVLTSTKSGNQRTKKASVLIVDDEADIVTIIKKGLELDGYSTYGFVNPEAALEHFARNPANYQVVILDVRMPGMSGFELAREIKSINRDVKIILMTAFEINMSEFKKVMPSMRVNGFVSKPMQLRELKTMIENLP